jgi:hypothetical protein
MVSVWLVGVGIELNVAVTVRACDMVTVHACVPAHAPPQPKNTWPPSAVALSVTEALALNVKLQFVPQLIPVGVDITLPEPALVMVSA